MSLTPSETSPLTELTSAVRELIAELRAARATKAVKSRRMASMGGLSPADLGHRLGKSPRTITRRIEEGLIAAKPFGRSWVIDQAEVERIDREGVGRSRLG